MATEISSSDLTIPALQPGDRMLRDEFERLYHAMTDCKKAELIEGVVYVPSPARLRHHAEPHFQLNTWLGVYAASTPGVQGADNATNRLDMENEPQPDCMLFIEPELGGQIRISEDDYVTGPPEFVAEFSSSSLALDRGPKLRTFQRHGVKEYLIWRVDDRMFEWNILRGSEYQLLNANEEGLLCSEVFPGLWLDAAAMIGGDLSRVLAQLQRGLESEGHVTFVDQLVKHRRA